MLEAECSPGARFALGWRFAHRYQTSKMSTVLRAQRMSTWAPQETVVKVTSSFGRSLGRAWEIWLLSYKLPARQKG